MGVRQRCVDCGVLSPETETNYTLISARHGWRLTRRYETDGRLVVEWRCHACWRVYRGAGEEVAPPSTERPSGKSQPAPSPTERPSGKTRRASETRRAASAASEDPEPTLVTGTAPPRRSRSAPAQGSRKR